MTAYTALVDHMLARESLPPGRGSLILSTQIETTNISFAIGRYELTIFHGLSSFGANGSLSLQRFGF